MIYKYLAGLDDATKCPVIGSIFVSGVVAFPQTIGRWKRLGVKDSKLITSKKRRILANNVKKESLAYKTLPITPQMIDDKTFNLNEWELIVSLQIIQDLLSKQNFQMIRLDNWEVTQKEFFRKLKKIWSKRFQKKLMEKGINLRGDTLANIEYLPEHKSDENYIVVGAASILSKTASEDEYEVIKNKFGDFGSGSPSDPKTRKFVYRHKENPPEGIIRTSWKTYLDLCKISNIEEDWVIKRTNSRQVNYLKIQGER